MGKQEFFLLIPAIIYGVAIVDLMKIFQHKKNYWEVVIWGIYLFLVVIFAWIELYDKLSLLAASVQNFFLIILQAMLYAFAVNVITPEEKDVDTQKYFEENRRLFFILLVSIIVMNSIIQLVIFDDQRTFWIRPVGLALLLACVFVDRKWVRLGVWSVFVVLAIIVIFQLGDLQ